VQAIRQGRKFNLASPTAPCFATTLKANTVQLIVSSRRGAFGRAMSDNDVDGVVDDAGAL